MTALSTLETLQFDNSFARLPDVFYAKVTPTPLKNPFLVSFTPDVAALIDLDPHDATRPEFAGRSGGHYLPPGSEPIAMVYAGHQFGAYVSRLAMAARFSSAESAIARARSGICTSRGLA